MENIKSLDLTQKLNFLRHWCVIFFYFNYVFMSFKSFLSMLLSFPDTIFKSRFNILNKTEFTQVELYWHYKRLVENRFCYFILLSFSHNFSGAKRKGERMTSLLYIYSPKIIHHIQGVSENIYTTKFRIKLIQLIQKQFWKISSSIC